jgi:hypothetical protein
MAAGLVDSTVASTVASTPASTAVSTTVSTTPRWFDSLDDGLKNYINARGLAEKDPATAFAETAKAHQEAQAYIGVPADRLVRLPAAGAPPEEWDAVYEKLGYSKNADDYKLEGLKFPDGKDVPPALVDHIRSQALALKLSPAGAKQLADQTVAFTANQNTTQTSEQQIEAATAAERLRQSWGPNYQANITIADRAYTAIMAAAGFDQATMSASIQKLREVQGTEGVMQMLLAVGQRISEDSFTSGFRTPADPNALIASVDQAKARKAELLADADWAKRFAAGGSAEVREMAALDMRIVGVNDRGEPL